MARPLQEQEQHPAATAPLLLLVVVVVVVVATVVVSLCASSKHARLWKQRPESPSLRGGGGKQLIVSLSGKAAAVARMVSWNRRSPAPEGGDEAAEAAAGEEALWKKTIMMGDRCRPLEFSGHITFDSDGNELPATPPAAAAAAAAKN